MNAFEDQPHLLELRHRKIHPLAEVHDVFNVTDVSFLVSMRSHAKPLFSVKHAHRGATKRLNELSQSIESFHARLVVMRPRVGQLSQEKLDVVLLLSITPSIVGAPPLVGSQPILGIGAVVAIEKGEVALEKSPRAHDGSLRWVRHFVVDFLMQGREHSLASFFHAGDRVNTRTCTKICSGLLVGLARGSNVVSPFPSSNKVCSPPRGFRAEAL